MSSPELRVARLASFRGRWYWIGTAGWVLWFVTPLGPGWLIGRLFHELQEHGTTRHFWLLLGGLLGAPGSGIVVSSGSPKTV